MMNILTPLPAISSIYSHKNCIINTKRAIPNEIRNGPINEVSSNLSILFIENKSARLTVMQLDGTIVGRFGKPGRGMHEFYQPWDLAVLSDGRVLVADTGNHRLVELTP